MLLRRDLHLQRALQLRAVLRLPDRVTQPGAMGNGHPHEARDAAAEAEFSVAAILGLHADRLRAFVAARVPSDDVDDVLQTAALRAIERSATLRDRERALAWLYRIHRNTIVDLWRQRAGHERFVEAEEAPDASTFNAEAPCNCGVAQAKKLKPAYASILALVDLGDSTLQEAAETLGISVNNATVRLHRARKALRDAMRDHCGVVNPSECLYCRCAYEGCCSSS
ncbi:MAG: sigma-70 family RNA polymerase sigma factor [Acidobacteriota bacterium]